jgi:hypothetical protein
MLRPTERSPSLNEREGPRLKDGPPRSPPDRMEGPPPPRLNDGPPPRSPPRLTDGPPPPPRLNDGPPPRSPPRLMDGPPPPRLTDGPPPPPLKDWPPPPRPPPSPPRPPPRSPPRWAMAVPPANSTASATATIERGMLRVVNIVCRCLRARVRLLRSSSALKTEFPHYSPSIQGRCRTTTMRCDRRPCTLVRRFGREPVKWPGMGHCALRKPRDCCATPSTTSALLASGSVRCNARAEFSAKGEKVRNLAIFSG